MNDDLIIRTVLFLILGIVIFCALFASFFFKSISLSLGTLTLIIFLFFYAMISVIIKKKIFFKLKMEFGDNVVKVAAAIIQFFEIPLAILLSVTVTTLIIALAILFILGNAMGIFSF